MLNKCSNSTVEAEEVASAVRMLKGKLAVSSPTDIISFNPLVSIKRISKRYLSISDAEELASRCFMPSEE